MVGLVSHLATVTSIQRQQRAMLNAMKLKIATKQRTKDEAVLIGHAGVPAQLSRTPYRMTSRQDAEGRSNVPSKIGRNKSLELAARVIPLSVSRIDLARGVMEP